MDQRSTRRQTIRSSSGTANRRRRLSRGERPGKSAMLPWASPESWPHQGRRTVVRVPGAEWTVAQGRRSPRPSNCRPLGRTGYLISEIGPLPRFGGQLHHVKPRFPGIRGRAGRAIGPELEDRILAGIVTRPHRQARTVRVAGLGEVDPVALRHPGDLLILGCRRWWWRPEAAATQSAEHETDFAAVWGSCPHAFPHGSLNIGEPVAIDGRTVDRKRIRGEAGRLGLAEIIICP